jgi:hypothetical protein
MSPQQDCITTLQKRGFKKFQRDGWKLEGDDEKKFQSPERERRKHSAKIGILVGLVAWLRAYSTTKESH